jgi:predicted nucleotidyltransferase
MIGRIKSGLEDFGKRHGEVLGVFLFGSYAQDRALQSSDIDVALYVEPGVIREGELGLQLSYAVELEGILGKRVDVVILNQAPPVLRHQIFRKGELIFERDPLRVRRFMGDALIEFYDEITTLEAAQNTLIRRHLLGR